MANTKKLTKPERKRAKRASRKALRGLKANLTRTQRSEFGKAKKGIKAWLAETTAAKAEKTDAPAEKTE